MFATAQNSHSSPGTHTKLSSVIKWIWWAPWWSHCNTVFSYVYITEGTSWPCQVLNVFLQVSCEVFWYPTACFTGGLTYVATMWNGNRCYMLSMIIMSTFPLSLSFSLSLSLSFSLSLFSRCLSCDSFRSPMWFTWGFGLVTTCWQHEVERRSTESSHARLLQHINNNFRT